MMKILLLIILSAAFPLDAKTGRYDNAFIYFDFSCTSHQAFMNAHLEEAVSRTVKRLKFEGPDEKQPANDRWYGTVANRVFEYDLNQDSKPEYFVPLHCGATGNCHWAIYASDAQSEIGLINTEYIYIHRPDPRSPWPHLTGSAHISACECAVEVFQWKGNRYQKVGKSFWSTRCYDPPIYEKDTFPHELDKAKPACKSMVE